MTIPAPVVSPQACAGRPYTGPAGAGVRPPSRAQGTAAVSRRKLPMSIKSKVFAAAATLTLVGGASAMGALTAGTASAATPSCGDTCVEFFSAEFANDGSPNFVLDTLRQGEKVGQPQILFRTSDPDPAEDYTISDQGLVSDFYTAGLVSSSVALHYGGLGCEGT